MRREYFGILGSLLGETGLARFLIIAAVAPHALRAQLVGSGSPDKTLDQLEKVRLTRAHAAPSRRFPLRITLPTARRLATEPQSQAASGELRDLLPKFWAALNGSGLAPFAVTLVNAPIDLDRQWLVEILTRQPEVASVLFEAKRPPAGLWTWPLKIGVPDTDEGRRLRGELLQARYGDLYAPVVVGPRESTVDLLLFPGSLSAAMDQQVQGRVMADAVLVLGRAELPATQSVKQLKSLMERYRGGLSGVCFVPREERTSWFQTLLRELSHNNSLPDGVFRARDSESRRQEQGNPSLGDLAAPLLMGDARFVRSTQISDAAQRLARDLQDIEPSAPISIDPLLWPAIGAGADADSARAVGVALEGQIGNFNWDSESGDATTMVRLQRALEPQLPWLGRPRSAPPRAPRSEESARSSPPAGVGEGDVAAIGGGDDAAPPPFAPSLPNDHALIDDLSSIESEAARPPRRVQARIAPLTDAIDAKRDVSVPLSANSDYRLHVHIGVDKGGNVIVADRPLDEDRLPDRPGGHELKIVYCPLSKITGSRGDRIIARPTQAMLILPPLGDSGIAEFALRCGDRPSDFRARLIVSHENSVLQTLLITAKKNGVVKLAAENFYTRDLGSHGAGRPVDIAFVINDNPQGDSGLTTMVKDSVSFLEPDGMKQVIDNMRMTLSKAVVAAVGTEPDLEAPETVALMIKLANYGAAVVEEIRRFHQLAKIDSAERVQVVEALQNSYFPVEFLYSGEAPELTAKLCPNAATALASGTQDLHLNCPHRKDSSHVCPAAFWGFQKCIERQASTGSEKHTIGIPELSEERLGPFKSALVAASDRAKNEMKGPAGVTAAVKTHVDEVLQAASWKEWKQHVEARSPDLMVILPHTEDSTVPGIAALEVSLDSVLSNHIKRPHVQAVAATGKGPLVLLLGCSTLITDTPFLNFVRRFNLAGAPVVVGTLSIIHGTQAALLAKTLLDEIDGSLDGELRFDEAILKVKRKLLSQGHQIAFSLVTYGHGSWRV